MEGIRVEGYKHGESKVHYPSRVLLSCYFLLTRIMSCPDAKVRRESTVHLLTCFPFASRPEHKVMFRVTRRLVSQTVTPVLVKRKRNSQDSLSLHDVNYSQY